MAANRMPYRNSLRVLGRLLNGDKARMVTLCEIDQGFMLYYAAAGQPDRMTARAIHYAEVMDLHDALQRRGRPALDGALKSLWSLCGPQRGDVARFHKTHPLSPQGYEEALRAVGRALDRRVASAVTVCELDTLMHVEYTVERADFVLREGHRMALAGRRQESYTAATLADLVRSGQAADVEQVQRSGKQLAHVPLDIVSLLDAAHILEDHGEHDSAENLYRRALEAAPRHPDLPYYLARHARRRGDLKAAQKYLHTALQHDAADARCLHLLGCMHLERGQHKEAAQMMEQAVACAPSEPVYRYRLERLNAHLGRKVAPLVATPAVAMAPLVPLEQHVEAETVVYPYPDAATANRRRADGPASTIEERLHGELEQMAPGQQAALDQWAGYAPLAGTSAGEHDSMPAMQAWPQEDANSFSRPVEPPAEDAAASTSVINDFPAAYERSATSPFDSPVAGWGDTFSIELPSRLEPADAPFDTGTLAFLPANAATAPPDPAWAPVPVDEQGAGPAAEAEATPTGAPAETEHGQAGEEHYEGLIATAEPMLPSSVDEAVQLAAAVLRVEEQLRAEPHRADLHRKLGFLLAKQGRSEEAAAAFRRAVTCGRRRLAS